MSVPNGFGVFFDDGDNKDSSPSPPNNNNSSQPRYPPRHESTPESFRNGSSTSNRSRASTHGSDSSGYASSESPTDNKTNGLPLGLEPIVEEEKDVVFEEPTEDDDDGDDDGYDDDDDEGMRVEGKGSTVDHEGVVYDVPTGRQQQPHSGAEADSNESKENYYEKIELTPTRLNNLQEDVPSNWITMETEVVMANVINISHLATETVAYTGAGLDDGLIFIYIIRAGISKVDGYWWDATGMVYLINTKEQSVIKLQKVKISLNSSQRIPFVGWESIIVDTL